MPKSEVIYLKRHTTLSNENLREKIAQELKDKGYDVNAFCNVICVNYLTTNKYLTHKQAKEVIEPYLPQKSPTREGCIRIDVVWHED